MLFGHDRTGMPSEAVEKLPHWCGKARGLEDNQRVGGSGTFMSAGTEEAEREARDDEAVHTANLVTAARE